MSIIIMIIVGFIVGLIARAIMPGDQNMGIIMTTILGIIGAVVAGFLGQSAAQLLNLLGQGLQLLQAALAVFQHTGGDGGRLLAQLPTGLRQVHTHAALIVAVALALQPTGSLHALEQRRQRTRIQVQALAQLGDHAAIAFPQYQEHQVLRVGQTQWFEQGLVQLGHCQ